MKHKDHRKQRLLVLGTGILSFLLFTGAVQAREFQVYLFGGINHVSQYGSEDDYETGTNDFPVTPAHTPVNFGLALAYFFTDSLGVELDVRYTLSSDVTLEDPSDGDTVDIPTSEHYALTLNLIYRFSKGSFRPYVLAGVGIDNLLSKDGTYMTEYGYDINISAPESPMDFVVNLGAGIKYLFGSRFGVRADARYVMILDDPATTTTLNAVIGLFIGF